MATHCRNVGSSALKWFSSWGFRFPGHGGVLACVASLRARFVPGTKAARQVAGTERQQVSAARYPLALQILHWSLALLFAAQVALILVFHQLESLEMGQIVLSLHRQFGTVILLLVFARLVLARRMRRPVSDLPLWQRRAADGLHLTIYAALAAQPLLGMLSAWARGDDVTLLGILTIPRLIAPSVAQGVVLDSAHRLLAFALLALLAVHLGAVLFNRIVRKTSVIERMLPAGRPTTLVNRMPVPVQLSCCFGIILAVTFGAGLYSAHRYSAFKEQRMRFDEVEVTLLDDMRAAQSKLILARIATDDRTLAAAAAETASAMKDFEVRLSDPGARAAAQSTAKTLGRVVAGNRSAKTLDAAGSALQSAIDAQYMVVFQGRLAIAQAAAVGHDMIILALAPTILLCGVLAFLLSRSILRALSQAHDLVRSVEEEASDQQLTIVGKGDFAVLVRDIVRMCAAVSARQQAHHEREVSLIQTNSAREADLAARAAAREADLASKAAQEQARIVDGLRQGLSALVSGNLHYRIADPYPAAYEQIRVDFNEAMQRIEAALEAISGSSGTIDQSSRGVARAADDLAARTSQQALNLSEAAAALGQMTGQIGLSADNAQQVAVAVKSARALAGRSDDLVGQAVAAIGEIEASSSQIVGRIALIERIAARSALLSLNASIEAARAGEGGKGFAVVAQEVRALAQQAGEAAGEIRTLVGACSQKVDAGVISVRNTGDALHRIVREVNGVDDLVSGIAASAQEQATGLAQVNRMIEQMNRVVQENAAMVRETTAELQTIRGNTASLDQLIKQVAGA